MTDGPYKNAALTSRWKKFGNALDNDAMSGEERTERAERALSEDLSKDFRALAQDIDRYVKRPQLDLVPRSAVDKIFERHPRSPLADMLQRFMSANLAKAMTIERAFTLALNSTIQTEQYSARNHVFEATMHARDCKDLPASRYVTVIERLDEAIGHIDVSKMREDVLTNKTSPKAALSKKAGIDDGPSI